MKITIEQLNEASFPSWVPTGSLLEVPESVVDKFRDAGDLDKETSFKSMTDALLPVDRIRKTRGVLDAEVVEFRSTRFRTKDGGTHIIWFAVQALEWEEKTKNYDGFPQTRTTTQKAVFWFAS